MSRPGDVYGTEILLQTDRLLLRRLTEADAGEVAALHGDPAVMRFLGDGGPVADTLVRARDLPPLLADYGPPPLGYWAAEDRATRCFLGWLGLCPVDVIRPATVELGYRLRRSAWGRGLATEGARALVDAGLGDPAVGRVTATTMAVNVGSRRVLEKVGLTWRRTFFEEWPVPIAGAEHGDVEYALDRDGWSGRAPRRPPPSRDARAARPGDDGARAPAPEPADRA